MRWSGLLLLLLPSILSFTPSSIDYQSCAFRLFTVPPSRQRLLYSRKNRARFNSKQPLRSLDTRIQTRLKDGAVLLVDANNVRGVDGFKLTTYDFLRSLTSWRRALGVARDSIVCVMDHGGRANAFSFDGITLIFAGPNRTADDVIAQDCRWLTTQSNTSDVLVITSDVELQSRCVSWNHESIDHGVVQVFGSLHVLALVKRCFKEDTRKEEEGDLDMAHLLCNLSKLESDIRSYERPSLKKEYGDILREKDFQEKTWHRVLIAECLRQILERQTSRSSVAYFDCPLSRYQDMQNSFTGSGTVDLFSDLRLRDNCISQHALRRYLIETMDTAEMMGLASPNDRV